MGTPPACRRHLDFQSVSSHATSYNPHARGPWKGPTSHSTDCKLRLGKARACPAEHSYCPAGLWPPLGHDFGRLHPWVPPTGTPYLTLGQSKAGLCGLCGSHTETCSLGILPGAGGGCDRPEKDKMTMAWCQRGPMCPLGPLSVLTLGILWGEWRKRDTAGLRGSRANKHIPEGASAQL